ncbi:MAG: DUF1640 domain-containing protein [Gammaproteobacteria bacterium]|nr:DUF1640 domain-containing protein [Gammaproteobacteria bacterium]MDE0273246.1 DUF1640 domain-containing protein [Gammaproteobacteria bacterium]
MAEAIDTLQIAEDLEASGLDREQAKAIAHAVRQGRGELVTKPDLEAGLAGLKADLLKWMFGAVFVIGAWVFALIRLLPPVGS